MKRSVSAAIALATSTFGFAAFAQQAGVAADGTAAVGTGTTGVTAAAAPAPAPAPAAAPAVAPAPAPVADVAVGGSDHDAMAGHLALGYLGFMNIPVGAIGNPNSNVFATTAAPIVGMRYWLNSGMGIDAGLGLTTTFGSTKTEAAGLSTSVNATAPTGIGVHFGVPIALSAARHYAFEIIPEMNLAYAQQAISTEANNNGGALDLSGLHVDLGARAGAEIHFGFIGVPELSLVGSIGLRASINQGKTEQSPPPGTAGVTAKATDTRTVIETTVGNNPWDIFTGNISAFYYL